MPIPASRLIAYYRSNAFADDFPDLAKRNPEEASRQLCAIITGLNDNLTALGITLTRTDMEVQAEFIAGRLPMHQMLDHCKLYAESIALRWLG